jgi:hypothetical protein
VQTCFMLERERKRESGKERENEEHLECGQALCLQGCIHPIEIVVYYNLYGTPSSPVREREKDREIKRYGDR